MFKTKTLKRRIVNEKTMIVAVDVGKKKNVGYCRCLNGNELKPFTFANNGSGFKYFMKQVFRFSKQNNKEDILIGFESTGVYSEPLLHFLQDQPVCMVMVNPLHTKRIKDLEGNSPGKTDKKDPKVIADVMQLNHALTVVVPQGAAAELRRITHERDRLMKERVALLNKIHAHAFIVFPELAHQMRLTTKSAQYLLRHCPTPDMLVEKGLDWLIETLRKVSMGQIKKDRAVALYKGAKTSCGIKEGLDGLLFSLDNMLQQLDMLEGMITSTERELKPNLDKIPYSKYILSIPGIGHITASILIGEVGDFLQFKTINELVKIAGLDLYEKSSGNRKSELHISKRGRALLRKILYFAALNVVRKNGIYHEKYQMYLKKNKKKNVALIAIAKKVLILAFALVRSNSDYDKNYNNRTPNMKLAA